MTTYYYAAQPVVTPPGGPGANLFVSARATTLAQAQSSSVDRKAYDFYAITSNGANDAPKWNGDTTPRTVLVQALPGNKWATTGLLQADAGGVPVTVNVAAGTYELPTAGVGQEAETIAYSALLAEYQANGRLRQRWFTVTGRTDSSASELPDVTFYPTDPVAGAGIGEQHGSNKPLRPGVYAVADDTFVGSYVVAIGNIIILNRPGTTADYGTQAGNVTVNCANAAADARACYYMEAGASQPTFTNAGNLSVNCYGSFVSGKAHAVSIYVTATEIQYVRSPATSYP